VRPAALRRSARGRPARRRPVLGRPTLGRPTIGRPTLGLLALALAAGSLAAVGLAALPAAAAPQGRVQIGAAPQLPSGAAVVGPLASGQQVKVDVVVGLRDPAGLAGVLAGITTPGSPTYRHYLSRDAFAATYDPDAATLESVRQWLSSAGLVAGPAEDGFVVPATGPASVVGQAFAAPLDSVRLASGAMTYASTAAPSVPAALAGVVRGVVGLNAAVRYHSDVVAPKALTPNVAVPQSCSAASSLGGETQGAVAGLYGFGGLFAQGRTGAGQTIALYELEGYSPSDVARFEQCDGLTSSVRSVLVDNGPTPGFGAPGPGAEAALDIDNLISFAPGASVIVYEGPNDNATGPLDVYAAIANDDAARVVSTSWGVCESLNGSSAAQMEQQVFSQMAMQGQTVVAASGDSGSEDCYPSGGTPTGLAVDDPSAQPLVTGVGGTTLPGGSLAQQTVWNDCAGRGTGCAAGFAGAGGGGVSLQWGLPTYQGAVVRTPCPAGSVSGTTDCRQVPDVAALASPSQGYPVAWDGSWISAGGTSAAAPLWAALFADIDQGCTTALGEVNPALYALGGSGAPVFNDVVSGENDFTQTNGGAFPATAGYDLATGWGSPQAAALAGGLQPSGGCPSVIGLSADVGPLAAGTTVTITGSGLAGATAVNAGALGPAVILAQTASSVTVRLPGATSPVMEDLTVTTPNGTSAPVAADRFVFGSGHAGNGYDLSATDGGIFSYGNAAFHGSMGGQHLNAPVVSMATTPGALGYWEVASDGGIFAFGNAAFHGSMGGQHLNAPIVGIAATADGGGYWEVASDGGIFAFGDAAFHGSMGGRHLNAPIVALAATFDGAGYWEVASDGGIFAFGDAAFHGSMGGQHLNAPVVGIAATFDGGGYWEVASDGGIFAFGDAPFTGSMGGQHLNKPIVGLASSFDSAGYWEVASDGGIFAFGDATFFGSAGSLRLVAPVVALATS
jgi:hypothetical protein